MIPPPFRYHRVSTAAEAVSLLEQIPGSVLLAGGQTLINALKLNLVAPTALIDIHRVDELRRISAGDEAVTVGSAATYDEIATSEMVRLRVPALASGCAALVDRQVRNRGTIGGNVCLNDPTNNLPPLLAALGATFEVRSGRGVHRYSVSEFFQGTMLTAASGAVLTSITVPHTPSHTRVFYRHQQVGADSWAVARVVGSVALSSTGLRDVRLYLAAVPGSPVRLVDVEATLEGTTAAHEARLEAALTAFDGADLEFVGDAHGSASFRRHLARVQLKRVVRDMTQEETAA